MLRIEGGRKETFPVDDGPVDLARRDEPAPVVDGPHPEGEAPAGGEGGGSAKTSTLPPTGVARTCWIRSAVPTVVWPAAVKGAAACTVSASSQATSCGVDRTGTSPLPTVVAVSASVTS